MSNLRLVHQPEAGIVRISSRRYPPYEPAPWSIHTNARGYIEPLPNRFDDIGPTREVTRDKWFQTLYAAGNTSGAFGELLAQRRRFGPALEAFDRTSGIGPRRDISQASTTESDPEDSRHGMVSRSWRITRQITSARLVGESVFVDLSHPATLSFLRANFVPVLLAREPAILRDNDFDLSDVMSRNRTLTQHLARYLHELPRTEFAELNVGEEIAGIRYLSRHSPDWECWALFADRIEGKLKIGESRVIAADDPDLLAVAKHFGLSVETDSPGEFLRPWLDS